jgi:hypothetical protein
MGGKAVAHIIEELKRRPSRNWSIVITIFGDAIVPRGGSVWLGTLLDFFRKDMAALGYQPWTGKPEHISDKGSLTFFTRDNQRILVLSLSRNDEGRTRIDITPTTARVSPTPTGGQATTGTALGFPRGSGRGAWRTRSATTTPRCGAAPSNDTDGTGSPTG